MISFTEKDIDAIALMAPATANNNAIEIDALVAQAHIARSEHLRDMFAGVAHNISNRIQKYRDSQRALAQLQGMTSRELSDIGITRGEISFALQGDVAEKASFFAGLKEGIIELSTKIAEARLRREGYHQLEAMDYRELSDIGLTRGDISNVMAGKAGRANDNVHVANNNKSRQVS